MFSKVIFNDFNGDDIFDIMINIYEDIDEITYLSLKKDKIKGKYERLISLLKYDNYNIEKYFKNNEIMNVDLDEEDDILIFDDDEYIYNENIDLYINISHKVCVSPCNNFAYTLYFISFMKLIENE